MIQNTYTIKCTEELKEIADIIHGKQIYGMASDKVLLAWAQIWDADSFDAFRDEIYRLFPEFTTIGTNHYSITDILNNRIDGSGEEHSITLSFLFFEDSGASLAGIEPGAREEEREGRELNAYLDGFSDVRGVYLVTPDYFCSAEGVLKEGIKGFESIPFFGVKASLLPTYRNFGYEAGRELVEQRLFVLVFHGKRLSIRTHYNLGWTPVGKVMTVTKEENPFFVDEIDDKPATRVYNKYLGLRNDQIIPENRNFVRGKDGGS